MKRAGEALLVVVFFAIMFVVLQLATCWFVWILHGNNGVDYPGPVECTVETIAGHFGRDE